MFFGLLILSFWEYNSIVFGCHLKAFPFKNPLNNLTQNKFLFPSLILRCRCSVVCAVISFDLSFTWFSAFEETALCWLRNRDRMAVFISVFNESASWNDLFCCYFLASQGRSDYNCFVRLENYLGLTSNSG